MKFKVTCLLLLCSTLFLSSVNATDKKAADKKAPAAPKFKIFVSCAGVQPFFYGFTYYPGQRVVYANTLYQASQTNSSQWPGFGPYWIWLGPCN
ncbi:hypothetical protein [Chitinophaga solisilvae]|uniref:Uncharacterized protein n=1 Tax=Chitinophaga solisilvae TaxID=1233460 RepID=A0A433WJJ5_9BACT|nr:hypothetical protein [Chitinophaga solisilvae]NSL85860.1 hypothetical protein [Chitinophaga solisilvae]